MCVCVCVCVCVCWTVWTRAEAKPYRLIKQRMRPTILDIRVHSGGDMDSAHRLADHPHMAEVDEKDNEPEKEVL